MIKKAYKGYKAFDYLTPGTDYPVFKLAKWDWAGRTLYPLQEQAQEDRVLQIVANNVVIATHEHPCYFTEDMRDSKAYHNAGREFCAYDALAESYIGPAEKCISWFSSGECCRQRPRAHPFRPCQPPPKKA